MNLKTKTRPILFTAEMVRAILDGRKTQTRRVIKPQPLDGFLPTVGRYCPNMVDRRDGEMYPGPERFGVSDEEQDFPCPYGQPSDRLWVRETWQPHPEFSVKEPGGCLYRADRGHDLQYPDGKWRPSIYMPRWASRITLEIGNVRVERVQEISEDDAGMEGAPIGFVHSMNHTARAWFHELWDSINAKRGYGWDANPWVWVVEFKRV